MRFKELQKLKPLIDKLSMNRNTTNSQPDNYCYTVLDFKVALIKDKPSYTICCIVYNKDSNHKYEYREINYSNNIPKAVSQILFLFQRNLKLNKLDSDGIDISNLSDEQRDKVIKLRVEKNIPNISILINNLRSQYCDQFKKGSLIKYKNYNGIITEQLDRNKFIIKVKDDYHTVIGTSLLLRPKQDLSNIKWNPELDKLTTEKLLQKLRARRYRGRGYGEFMEIKKILATREHVTKK